MPIDPQLAVEAATLYGAVKATNEAAKLPGLAPVVGVVNERVRAYAEAKLAPLLRRVLPLDTAAKLAAAEVSARLANVPPELLVEPPAVVAAGVVEALQTRADEPTLRALFAELLASACRADRADGVHLAYVEVLRQLEPDEARLLAHVPTYGGLDAGEHVNQPGLAPLPARFSLPVGGSRWEGVDGARRLAVAAGNLLRLGLLALETTVSVGELRYSGYGPATTTRGRYVVTDFGRGLLAVCAPDGIPDGAPGLPPRT